MQDPVTRVMARIQQIESLLCEASQPNEGFGAVMELASSSDSTARRVGSAGMGSGPAPPPLEPAAIAPMIEAAEGRTGLSGDLISAVIAAESAYQPGAV